MKYIKEFSISFYLSSKICSSDCCYLNGLGKQICSTSILRGLTVCLLYLYMNSRVMT